MVDEKTLPIAFDPDAPPNAPICFVHTHLLIWRCFPASFEKLTFELDEQQCIARVLHRSGITGIYCPREIRDATPILKRQPFFCWARLVRDGGISFLFALLFHLVPSIIWGAENSLGSPWNHALMGVVWFGGWPLWFVFAQLLRPWGIAFSPGCTDCTGCESVFVPFASYAHAQQVQVWWASAMRDGKATTRPPVRTRCCNTLMAIGLLIWAALIANAIYTGVQVLECVDRGCCADDKSTLDSCVATGYPNRIVD